MSSSHLFVSVNRPDRKQSRISARAVRSWITTHQLNRRRGDHVQGDEGAETVATNRFTLPQSERLISNHVVDAQSDSCSGDQAAWQFMQVEPTGQLTRETRRKVQAHIAHRQHEKRRKTGKQEQADSALGCMSESNSLCSSVNTPSTNGTPPLIFPCPTLVDPTNLLEICARKLDSSVAIIWSHYLWQEREHGKAFIGQYRQFQGCAPRILHPLILGNQALLATTILFTGSHLRSRQGGTAASAAILDLRSLAHQHVQAAIDNETERLADATILAVLKMALYEAIFGLRKAYQVHMQAVARMVRLRDGLANLGMQGYLAHLLVWFDANMSDVTSSQRFLADELAVASFIREVQTDEDNFKLGVLVEHDAVDIVSNDGEGLTEEGLDK